MLKVNASMLAVLLSFVLVPWVNGQQPKGRVYVWDFVDNKGQRTELTDRLTSEFEEALIQAKCYQVLERRQFDKVLAHIKNEKAIADLNDIPKSSQGEFKKITNAQIVVFGKVDDDVESGQIKISVTFQHFDSSKEVKSIRIPRGKRFDNESRENAMQELVKEICGNNNASPLPPHSDHNRQGKPIEPQSSDNQFESKPSNSRAIQELTQTLNRIKEIKVSFEIKLPLRHRKLQQYSQRLQKSIAQVIAEFNSLQLQAANPNVGMFLERFNTSHSLKDQISIEKACPDERGIIKPCSFMFHGNSPYFPIKEKEDVAYSLFNRIHIKFELFKPAIDIKEYKDGLAIREADLDFSVYTGKDQDPKDLKLTALYLVGADFIVIRGTEITTVLQDRPNISSIKTVSELAGAQMFVYLNPGTSAISPSIFEDVDAIEKENSLIHLTITVNGEKIVMSKHPSCCFVNERGDTIYVYTFPRM